MSLKLSNEFNLSFTRLFWQIFPHLLTVYPYKLRWEKRRQYCSYRRVKLVFSPSITGAPFNMWCVYLYYGIYSDNRYGTTRVHTRYVRIVIDSPLYIYCVNRLILFTKCNRISEFWNFVCTCNRPLGKKDLRPSHYIEKRIVQLHIHVILEADNWANSSRQSVSTR